MLTLGGWDASYRLYSISWGQNLGLVTFNGERRTKFGDWRGDDRHNADEFYTRYA